MTPKKLAGVPRRGEKSLPRAVELWLTQVRRDYQRRFPKKLALLARQVERLAKSRHPAEYLAALNATIRRLYGSSGTHGLSESSRILREWWKWLGGLKFRDGPLPPRSMLKMRRFLQRLELAGAAAFSPNRSLKATA